MSKLKNIGKRIINPFLLKKPEHLKVVVLCIAVATTFWFFIAFNKTYTTVFSYPINYKYNKEKLIPVNKLTQYVEISLTGQGWNLLKEYFSIDKRDIDIELPNEPGKTVVNEAQFIASASNIFKNVTINSVFSDSIFCNLDYKISKLVALYLPKDSIILNNGYSISSDIIIDPKEIYITGPASIIDLVNDTFQLTLLEEIDDDFDDDVKLNLPDRVLCENDEVVVSFDISPYIEIEKEFSYSVIGGSDSLLILEPKSIIGSCYLPENLEDLLNDSSISINLDLTNFVFKKDTFIPISEIIKPDFVRKGVLEDTLIQIRKIND